MGDACRGLGSRVARELAPFIDVFSVSEEIRRMIYTTNAVEAVHRQFRKVTKAKGSFPTDEALKKMLYLATIDLKRTLRHKRDWPVILGQLKNVFGDRIGK